MCLTCGCDKAHDDHGDPAHLTIDDVSRSAAVDGISVREAGRRIRQALKADRAVHPGEHGEPITATGFPLRASSDPTGGGQA